MHIQVGNGLQRVLISSLVAYGSSHMGVERDEGEHPMAAVDPRGQWIAAAPAAPSQLVRYIYIFTLNTPHKPCYSKGSTMIDIYLGPFNPGLFG